jgi:signal transduction histidine kinase/ligand-binding sensor domain-containing protein
MKLTPTPRRHQPSRSLGSAVLATGLLLTALTPARALDPETPLSQYMVDAWQEEAGLPQKFVLSVLQTRDGYLWIGTKGGLARFDGVRFVTYDDRNPEQLRESEVWALAEDRDGSLWIATYGGGLSRLQDGRFITFTTKDGLPSDFVAALCLGPDGSLWIGTDRGLSRLQSGRFTTFRRKDGLPSDAVRALHLDERGVLWIGTLGGLRAFQDGRIIGQPLARRGGPDHRVTAIAGDGKGGLWLATGAGLMGFSSGVVKSVTLPGGAAANVINALFADSNGTLWIGTEGGLCRQRHGRIDCAATEGRTPPAQRAVESVTQGQVQALHADREGSLWVATRVDGLVRLKDSAFQNVSVGEVDGRAVGAATVTEDHEGAMWFGTGSGLRRLVNGALTSISLPGGGSAEVICEDLDGSLWIGSTSAGGLYRLRAGRVARVSLPGLDGLTIRALLVEPQGRLWIGTDADGLFALDAGKLTHYTSETGLLGDQVRALARDGQGGLWIGTRDGGLTDLRDGTFKTFGPAEGLASSSAQAIFVGANDVVWVATRRGLCRVRDGRVVTLTAESGLPANFFYQIVGDGHGSLWLTFGRGIVRVSENELNDVADGRARQVTAVTFGTSDGMRSTAMVVPGQPTAWRGRDGRLWFATDRGVVVTDPAAMARNSVPPPVVIENVKVDKRAIAPASALESAPGAGDLEVHYTALSFVAPEKVRFKYRLEGFDGGWVEAGRRRVAFYTNLPPGRYVFRVMACNNAGVWNEAGAALALRLKPHFYQTVWFYGLCGLLVVLLFWAGHLYHVREMKAQFAAVLADRGRIARDLHDTLAQSVVGISAQLQAIKTLLFSAPQAAAEHLDLAVEMVRHTLVEVRRSVWDIRSQALENADLAAALSETARQLSAAAPIRFQVTGTPRPIPKAIENHLLHIGQEALSNAIKHAEATNIELDLAFEGPRVVLGVRDDGRGFDSERPLGDQQGHFGLIGMRERVQKLGGQLSIRSAPGRGTEVVAAVPVG